MIQVKSEHATQSLGSKKSLARNCRIRQNYACSGFDRFLFWKKNEFRFCSATHAVSQRMEHEQAQKFSQHQHSILSWEYAVIMKRHVKIVDAQAPHRSGNRGKE